MPSPNQNRIVGIIGSKGTGKSSLAEHLFKTQKRALVYDTMGEYNVGYCVSEHLALVRYLRRNETFRVAYLPLEQEDFGYVCRVVRLKGNMTLIVEEVSQFCTSVGTDPEFSKCIQLGRHARLNIVYTGQRFADIARRITSQTDLFCVFRVSEPRDLDAIEARFGTEVTERISKLGDLRYLKLTVGKDNKDAPENVVRLGDWGTGRRVVYHRATSDASSEVARANES